MNYYNTIKAAQLMDITIEDAIKMRIRNLRKEIQEVSCKTIDSKNEITCAFDKMLIENRQNEIKKLRQYAVQSTKKNNNSITSSDIEAARNIPIESIIEFTNGKAIAWCHEDKTPSLSKHPKDNYARCFVCNKSFDTIAAYMHYYNVEFIDAVKGLLCY